MRIYWMAVMVLLYGTVANAGTVAVAPVSYRDAGTGEQLADVAAKAEAKVVEGAREAGHDVLFGSTVKEAVEAQGEDGVCNRDCLGKVAAQLGAGEVVLVQVEDTDQVSYKVTLTFVSVDEIAEEKTDGFYVVLEWLKGVVALSLKDVPSEAAPVDAPVESEPTGETAEPGPEDASAGEESPMGRKRLGRKPFVISALATAGLGITTLIIDGVVRNKYNTMEDRIHLTDDPMDPDFADKLDDEMKRIDNLQVVEGVFLGLTLAGAVTTGILAIFTDFKKGDEAPEPDTVSLRPLFGAGKGGGMVGVGGRF